MRYAGDSNLESIKKLEKEKTEDKDNWIYPFDLYDRMYEFSLK